MCVGASVHCDAGASPPGAFPPGILAGVPGAGEPCVPLLAIFVDRASGCVWICVALT